MKRVQSAIVLAALVALASSVYTQQAPMSFFVTSAGPGDGANLGGLEGADAHCQMLAAGAGRGSATWRAYLSQASGFQGPAAINARDRMQIFTEISSATETTSASPLRWTKTGKRSRESGTSPTNTTY